MCFCYGLDMLPSARMGIRVEDTVFAFIKLVLYGESDTRQNIKLGEGLWWKLSLYPRLYLLGQGEQDRI